MGAGFCLNTRLEAADTITIKTNNSLTRLRTTELDKNAVVPLVLAHPVCVPRPRRPVESRDQELRKVWPNSISSTSVYTRIHRTYLRSTNKHSAPKLAVYFANTEYTDKAPLASQPTKPTDIIVVTVTRNEQWL